MTARSAPVQVTDADLKCRFGCDHPIGIFHVPKGCLCWDDPIQALCHQHFVSAESNGPIVCIVDFTRPVQGPAAGDREIAQGIARKSGLDFDAARYPRRRTFVDDIAQAIAAARKTK